MFAGNLMWANPCAGGWAQWCPTSCSLGEEVEIGLPHPDPSCFLYPRTTVGKAASWEDGVWALAQADLGEFQCSVLLLHCYWTSVSYLTTLLSVLNWKWVTTPHHIELSEDVLLVPHSTTKQVKVPLEHPSQFSRLLCPLCTSFPRSATNNVTEPSQTPTAPCLPPPSIHLICNGRTNHLVCFHQVPVAGPSWHLTLETT